MPTVDEYLALVEGPNQLHIEEPAEEALLQLLVAVAFSDGVVDADELAFLARILPGHQPSDIAAWAKGVVSQGGLDLVQVAAALPTVEERWKGLRFAARMAWKDRSLAHEERTLLDQLAAALSLPGGAVDTVLQEMRGQADGGVEPEHLITTLKSLDWDAVQLAAGELTSRDLLDALPDEPLHLVARVGVDTVEIMGLFQEGLVGRFAEGAAFIHWRHLVTYTRVPVFGASVQLHDEHGLTWTLVDTRLRGVGMLLDRLFQVQRPKPSGRPIVVEQVRGQK